MLVLSAVSAAVRALVSLATLVLNAESAAVRAEVSVVIDALAASIFDCRVTSAAERAFVSVVNAACSDVMSPDVAAPGAPSPTRLHELLSLLQM